MGEVCSDIFMSESKNGKKLASFYLMTNSFVNRTGDRLKERDIHHVFVVSDAKASFAEDNIYEGDMVMVKGRIKTSDATDQHDRSVKCFSVIVTGSDVLGLMSSKTPL